MRSPDPPASGPALGLMMFDLKEKHKKIEFRIQESESRMGQPALEIIIFNFLNSGS
jgi:hypothetical protein